MQAVEKHPISASSGNSDFSSISISGSEAIRSQEKKNNLIFFLVLPLLGLVFLLTYETYRVSRLNQVLSLDNVITKAENRILKDEVTELDRRPTYENGYKDALIRKGGPNDKGDYQNGWEDAMKLATKDSSYADGYHQAIQQYGYQKTSEYLVSEPMQSASK
ncbi:MAG: hypothetical protein WCG45_05565 [bacterium]